MQDKTTPILNYDIALGAQSLAGMDEAGRGPLAGPVVAACVMLPLDAPVMGVYDSKKVAEKKRERLYEEIIACAHAWGVGIVQAQDIDRINILNATRQAMQEAYRAMNKSAGMLVVDAMQGLKIDSRIHSIVKGDSTSYHVAAASIVAKVTRDRIMRQADETYPGYGFAGHKGYGTQAHYQALAQLGPCPLHRRSFLKNGTRATAGRSGQEGEDWAARFLSALGYNILERNYHSRYGEIDLIAQRDDFVAFCEVKTRKADAAMPPRVAVDAAKQRKIIQTAALYAAEQQLNTQLRFDVIEITLRPDGHTLTHIRHAFIPQGGTYAF